MKVNHKDNGSVLLIAVFAIALLSAVVIGLLQVNTEEIQLMRNQIHAAQAMAVAEAGMNDAFAEIRADNMWASGFVAKSFEGGSYTVAVTGAPPNLTIASTGTSAQGFIAKLEADVTLGGSSPYAIRIDNLRINE
jgi:Tfp pilus assembly protein PilX